MGVEAQINIRLRCQGKHVAGVSIQSSRMVQSSRLFAGKPISDVLTLLPAVYSLCGTAQALTGLAAIEKAGACRAAAPQQSARAFLIMAESVAEHGLTLSRDWPLTAGGEPRLDIAKRIKIAVSGLRNALYPKGDWLSPGGGTLIPDHDAVAQALDRITDAFSDLLGWSINELVLPLAFTVWLDRTAAKPGMLPGMVLAKNWESFGAAAFLPMPEHGPSDMAARLAADRDGRFAARPDSVGRVYETGPLAHWAWHPLIQDLIDLYGAGLLPRLAARLLAINENLNDMRRALQDFTALPPAPLPLSDGTGLAAGEAARGLLVHRVEIRAGMVERYQILAPTEWNFHPEGPLARGLTGARFDDTLESKAHLLIQALDPCVSYTLSLE